MHKSTQQVLCMGLNCCLGAYLMGFSLAYMNPALKTIDSVFHIVDVDVTNGMLSALIPIGAGVGSYLASILLEYFSRRDSLICADIIGGVGSIIQISGSFTMIIIGRLILGIACGLNSSIMPLYLNENTPDTLKGTTGSFVALMANVGVFVAFILGFNFDQYPSDDNQVWRIVFIFPIFTCILRTILLLKVYKYNSPLYYLSKDDEQGAREAILDIYKEQYAEGIYQELYCQSIRLKDQPKPTFAEMLKPRYLPNLIRCFILAFLVQLVGIMAVILFSTRIFSQATNNNYEVTNLLNLSLPVLSAIFILITGYLIQFIASKQFIQLGLLCSFITQLLLGYSAQQDNPNQTIIILLILIYISLYNLTLGSVYWIIIAELLPQKGVIATVVVGWIATSFVSQMFPILLTAIGIAKCFYIFSFFGLVGLIYVTYSFELVPRNKPKFEEDNNPSTELTLFVQ